MQCGLRQAVILESLLEDTDNGGGEYEHTLSVAEMPKHNHTRTSETSSKTNEDNYIIRTNPEVSANIYSSVTNVVNYTTEYGTAYVNTGLKENSITQTTYTESEYGVAFNGEDSPHNNLQPYITCYMWKRTS